MERILPYLGVKHNYTEEDPAGRKVLLQDMKGLTVKQAQSILKEQGITCIFQGTGDTVTAQIPAAGQWVSGDSQMILYLGEVPEQTTVNVPDFSGMNRQQAADAAASAGLYILISGNTSLDAGVVVTAQSIPMGTQVAFGTVIELEFTDTKAAD